MASKKFTVEEVLAEVMKDEEEQEDEEEEKDSDVDSVDRDRDREERLKRWIWAFDGGDGVDMEFFRENAIQVMRPVLGHSLIMAHGSDTEGM